MPRDHSPSTVQATLSSEIRFQKDFWKGEWKFGKEPALVPDITANYHKGNAHSEAAHKKARHSSAEAKQTILWALQNAGEASCEKIEDHTSLSHQTCSARISELKRDGKITV